MGVDAIFNQGWSKCTSISGCGPQTYINSPFGICDSLPPYLYNQHPPTHGRKRRQGKQELFLYLCMCKARAGREYLWFYLFVFTVFFKLTWWHNLMTLKMWLINILAGMQIWGGGGQAVGNETEHDCSLIFTRGKKLLIACQVNWS